MAHDHLASTLHAAIAEEIREMRDLIEQIAGQLVANEQLALQFTEQLQTFDLLVQRADESADLLDRMAAGSRAEDAIDKIRLSEVQDRFRAALLTAA